MSVPAVPPVRRRSAGALGASAGSFTTAALGSVLNRGFDCRRLVQAATARLCGPFSLRADPARMEERVGVDPGGLAATVSDETGKPLHVADECDADHT